MTTKILGIFLFIVAAQSIMVGIDLQVTKARVAQLETTTGLLMAGYQNERLAKEAKK
jgi:hypothetical protein